ncbi:hypothetical protein G6F65_020155 [Rhizopus arrhizus]|nr:hypothetical protein G6F65_020155 [Rhizopus arrhizus]
MASGTGADFRIKRIHAAGVDAHEHLACTRFRQRRFTPAKRAVGRLNGKGAHGVSIHERSPDKEGLEATLGVIKPYEN